MRVPPPDTVGLIPIKTGGGQVQTRNLDSDSVEGLIVSNDLLTHVRTPPVPFSVKCSCGQRLRVGTGTWGTNGLPCFWAMCAKCAKKPVWCPVGMHIRVQELFKPGETNTGGEKPVPACVTSSCAHRHKEMIDDLDIFMFRPGSEDAWVAEEKWVKREATGPELDVERITAAQIVRVRKFVREINPIIQRARYKAKENGRPLPSLVDLQAMARAGTLQEALQ